MRQIIFKVALLLGLIVVVHSCYYEYPPEPTPFKPEDVSFKTHVLPILVSSCAAEESACHNNKELPDLSEENAYRQLTSGGYVNVTFPEESELYKAIEFGVSGIAMPPDGALSQLDKDLILTWIAKGVPND